MAMLLNALMGSTRIQAACVAPVHVMAEYSGPYIRTEQNLTAMKRPGPISLSLESHPSAILPCKRARPIQEGDPG